MSATHAHREIHSSPRHDLTTDILRDLLRFRRVLEPHADCVVGHCRRCLDPHLPPIALAIRLGRPITLVLPAFPGKSPNPAKVLGTRPDMGERLALSFLNELCERIRRRYAPGARIILCSDGRVFSDVIGMDEDAVTAYRRQLDQMIEELGLTNLSSYALDELFPGHDFAHARRALMEAYAQSPELLREKVRRGGQGSRDPEDQEAHRILCGITRFLVEDAARPGENRSRSAIQRDAKARAYEVIRRSNAWSELIRERFPHAVRLSIHPQTCGARKIGIQLLGTETWMTPWHGVAVRSGGNFVLMKRWEAEQLSARLVPDADGYPSHYQLESESAHV